MSGIIWEILSRIEKDPTGIDAKIGAYFFEDYKHNVFFDDQEIEA